MEGPQVVDAMEGSEDAKKKLKAVLEAVVGEKQIDDLCAELGIGKTAFYELRNRLLQAALEESEPKQPGRPRQELSPEQAENERLRAEVEKLRMDLEVAYVREEIMLAMPHLFEPLKKKRLKEQEQRERDKQRAKKTAKPGGAAPADAGPDPDDKGGKE